jgi:hypothetical protein
MILQYYHTPHYDLRKNLISGQGVLSFWDLIPVSLALNPGAYLLLSSCLYQLKLEKAKKDAISPRLEFALIFAYFDRF